MNNETTTAAIALAFTAHEESSALNSTVAWMVHIVADVSGWNGKPRKGGKAVAIKAAREKYGYRVDSDGESVLDAKGNRAKRSAVFNRLALVDKVIAYALANEKEWLETIHHSATSVDVPDEARDSRVTSEIEQFAARLADLAKGETIDALKFFLETGKAKVDEESAPVADIGAALGGDEAPAPAPAPPTESRESDFDKLMAAVNHMSEKQCLALANAAGDRITELRDLTQAVAAVQKKAA